MSEKTINAKFTLVENQVISKEDIEDFKNYSELITKGVKLQLSDLKEKLRVAEEERNGWKAQANRRTPYPFEGKKKRPENIPEGEILDYIIWCERYNDKFIDMSDRAIIKHHEELDQLKAENERLREKYEKEESPIIRAAKDKDGVGF